MAVYHGKNLSGTFDVGAGAVAIADITSFTVNETTNMVPYVSSSTSGSTSRKAGATDATGSITLLGAVVPTAIDKGSTGTLVLIGANSQEIYNGTVLFGSSTCGTTSEGLVTVTVEWGKT